MVCRSCRSQVEWQQPCRRGSAPGRSSVTVHASSQCRASVWSTVAVPSQPNPRVTTPYCGPTRPFFSPSFLPPYASVASPTLFLFHFSAGILHPSSNRPQLLKLHHSLFWKAFSIDSPHSAPSEATPSHNNSKATQPPSHPRHFEKPRLSHGRDLVTHCKPHPKALIHLSPLAPFHRRQ